MLLKRYKVNHGCSKFTSAHAPSAFSIAYGDEKDMLDDLGGGEEEEERRRKEKKKNKKKKVAGVVRNRHQRKA